MQQCFAPFIDGRLQTQVAVKDESCPTCQSLERHDPNGRDHLPRFQDKGDALRPLCCLSHEAYNLWRPRRQAALIQRTASSPQRRP